MSLRQIKFTEKRITTRSRSIDALFVHSAKYPVLSRESEATATPEQLVNHNVLFVISVAKRYEHAGVDLMDLVSEGMIGLIKAARQFEPSLGFRFTSYAVTRIRSEIIRYIESKRDVIRLPDKQLRLNHKLEHSQQPDEAIEETAKRLNISNGYVQSYLNKKKMVFLDAQDSEGETYIEVSGDIFADSITSTNDTKKTVLRAISKLTDREQQIIKMRFFSDSRNSLTAVSELLNISRERVRQIESIALKKLKSHIKVE